MTTPPVSNGIAAELRLILKRGRQVWHLVPVRHKLGLAGAGGIMAAASLCNIALALLLGRLVNAVLRGSNEGWSHAASYTVAAEVLGLIGLAYLLREALNIARRYLVENSCTRIHRDMCVRVVNHLMKINLASLSKDKVGSLHGRIYRSVEGFVRFLRLSFLDFVPALLTGSFALIAAVSKQPVLGLIMIGVIPTAVFLTIRQLISQRGVRLRLLRSCDEIDGAIVEQLGGIEYVRAANTYQQEIKRLARAAEKRRAMEIRHQFQMSLFGCAKALNEGLFHIIVLSVAIYYAINGQLKAGDVLTFSILFVNVMTPLAEIHRVIDEGHESSLRVGDLLEMLAEPLDASFTLPRITEPRLVPGEPAIAARDLVVEYLTPQGKCVHAVDNLSLTIRHGETIGIAGRSGCGKSTFLRVLMRLLHPHSGSMLLGGVPLEEVSRTDIGRLLGYVGQSPFVFSGTIAENIAYGNEHATPEDIQRAAEMAHLHDEILQMPGGYNAVLMERGSNLSGGQRQRLAIARILLKQPPILILDEATSALDNISERAVQQALGLTNTDRTTIIVAHRLSTLRDADRILVFDEGRIAEVGAYTELVQQGGLFGELVMSAENGLSAAIEGAATQQEPVAQSA
ncbi:MAG TPA: ABC transporter ATP-binding protein [Gemmataceae bacterium]|nr:ABC transporter ATP-binding protein [Gemmataceae bacterium]